ncbi:ubiquinol-cytochrome c reductase iron-sulfur subunit [Chloroflexales bacterium ZM16-3]|nr:ubiquinol-cytochrome c reductase iron-sulfur subunit [Chloroflexales bacterium ZM16-3]
MAAPNRERPAATHALPPLPADKGVWDEHAISRRVFLEVLFGVLAGIGALLVAIPGVRFLIGNSLEPSATKWVELGKVADLPTASVTQLNYSVRATDAWREVNQRGTVYISSADGGATFTALDATCTHLGCIVQWNEGDGNFVCPCHAGHFARDGEVIDGPPPRRLRQLAVKVKDGTLLAEI